jgi:hypothetical protein
LAHRLSSLLYFAAIGQGARLVLSNTSCTAILVSIALVAATTDLIIAVTGVRAFSIGLSRQTPELLKREDNPILVSLLWGVNTGSGLSTFRVTALVWVVMVAAVAGFAPWWIGSVYAAGFIIPLAAIIRFGEYPTERSCRWLGANRSIRRGAQVVSSVLDLLLAFATMGGGLVTRGV